MPKAQVYNLEGKPIREIELPVSVFGVKVKPSVLHQVYVSESANRRVAIAHTKTRGNVRGGGKKPWKQKGTGRARQGSIRSPQWKGGGVVFGPSKERNFEMKINKKMKKTALRMALAGKANDGQIIVMESLKLAEPKTKLYAKLFAVLPGAGKSKLIVPPVHDAFVRRATRNLPRVDFLDAKSLNVSVLMDHKFIVLTQETVDALVKSFEKK